MWQVRYVDFKAHARSTTELSRINSRVRRDLEDTVSSFKNKSQTHPTLSPASLTDGRIFSISDQIDKDLLKPVIIKHLRSIFKMWIPGVFFQGFFLINFIGLEWSPGICIFKKHTQVILTHEQV